MTAETALAAGRRAAEARMTDQVRIWRPGEPIFDRETGTEIPGPDLELYAGPARVRPVGTAGEDVDSGEHEVILRQYEVGVPWSAIPPAGLSLVPGDRVEVASSPDARMAGLSLWVMGQQYRAQATAWRIIAEDRS